MEKLLAYQDGELTRHQARKVARHVGRCSECERELHQLEAEARRFLLSEATSTDETARVANGLENVLERVRKWRAVRLDGVRPKIQEHVEYQLEMFFGSRTAVALGNLAAKRQGAPGVVSAVEPLFSAFLGEKAAALLASCAIERFDLSGEFAPEQAS
jgi:anti-sigma factor RsiW